MAKNALDYIYKQMIWIVVVLSLGAYLLYRTIEFNGSIERVVNDPNAWLNTLFIVYLQITVQSGSRNQAMAVAMETEVFKKADEINDKIIKEVKNKMRKLRTYVRYLNEEEKAKIEDDFFFSNGDVPFEKMTKRQKRKFKKLKPLQHNIQGFNYPLYYQLDKNRTLSYEASFDASKGSKSRAIKKIMQGLIYSGITTNVAFNANGIKEAFISIGIISVGLIITFVLSYHPVYFKLTKQLPKIVIQKDNLYQSFLENEHSVSEEKTVEFSNQKLID